MAKAPAPKAPAPVVTITPAHDFTGYPDGKTKVEFKAGVESEPITEEYAQLLRDKGHVAPRTQLHTPKDLE